MSSGIFIRVNETRKSYGIPEEHYRNSNFVLSAFIKNGVTHDPVPKEEKETVYNTLVRGSSYKDIDNFDDKIEEYLTNLSQVVPYDNTGLELRVDRDEEGGVKMRKGFPYDYLLWHLCTQSPNCASDKEEAKTNPERFLFYIHDTGAEFNREAQKVSTKDAAFELYLELKKEHNPDKIKTLCFALGIDVTQYTDVESRLIAIREFIQTGEGAERLINESNDEDLNLKAMIYKLSAAKKDKVFFDEDGSVFYDKHRLGSDIESAIRYIKAPERSDILRSLKGLEREIDKNSTIEA